MDAETIAKYLRFLAELIEKDQSRVAEMRGLSFNEILLLAQIEAEKNLTDAENLKNLGH